MKIINISAIILALALCGCHNGSDDRIVHEHNHANEEHASHDEHEAHDHESEGSEEGKHADEILKLQDSFA